MKRKIKTSAPGSTMFFGEHAVLHGKKAIAIAIDKRITITLTQNNSEKITIDSELGQYSTDCKSVATDQRFSFMIEAIKQYAPQLGFNLEVVSQFSHEVGLGSSAAITAATCLALAKLTHKPTDQAAIFQKSLEVILNVQGTGSGSDLAASVYGGIVSLVQQGPERIVKKLKLHQPPLIALHFCGYKMKTTDVIAHVQGLADQREDYYQDLYEKMGTVTEEAVAAIENSDWEFVGLLMSRYQQLLVNLGVSDHTLNKMFIALLHDQNIIGAKISGSGLGDCIISLGGSPQDKVGELIEVKICTKGVKYV